ncbi:MAG: AtpZ/AtpI family protein [Pseudomonadota bacterium]
MDDRERSTGPGGGATGDLAKRIAAARHAANPPSRRRMVGSMRGWELAFRMVLELLVGIAIGGFLGFAVDWLLGSLPAFTLIFGLLGFAAGVRVMLRSAEELNRRSDAGDRPDPSTPPDARRPGASSGDGG